MIYEDENTYINRRGEARDNRAEHPDIDEPVSTGPGLFQALINCAKQVAGNAEFNDGQATCNTLDIEALDRAIHNVDRTWEPEHPDSASGQPCAWGCATCKANDAAKHDVSPVVGLQIGDPESDEILRLILDGSASVIVEKGRYKVCPLRAGQGPAVWCDGKAEVIAALKRLASGEGGQE